MSEPEPSSIIHRESGESPRPHLSPRPHIFDVFPPRGQPGGKRVAVFDGSPADPTEQLQARSAAAGVPLSVFVQAAAPGAVHLRVFTPTREKGESDSASIAALNWAQDSLGADFAEVTTGMVSTPAQLCGGEWLLQQGVVDVQEVEVDVSSLRLAEVGAIHTASTARPNLVMELPTLEALDAFHADADTISSVNTSTGTTGLVLYTIHAPAQGPQRRADVSFRCFGPLKGFLEDAASSNMFACLTGVLNARGQLDPEGSLIRGAQRRPGQPATLTAQYGTVQEAVWVGGQAVRAGA